MSKQLEQRSARPHNAISRGPYPFLHPVSCHFDPRTRTHAHSAAVVDTTQTARSASASMCPMRFWLLFLSGIVAAYLAWTSALQPDGGGGGDGGRGFTLVHFSAELERFVWVRGCA